MEESSNRKGARKGGEMCEKRGGRDTIKKGRREGKEGWRAPKHYRLHITMMYIPAKKHAPH